MPAFTDWLQHKLFGRLLGAYPEEFRDEYGAEMQLDFDQRQHHEPLPRLVWGVLKDTAHTAPKEHFAIMLHDLRYALRQLKAQPAFTAVAVLSLALGIGANTAVFSLADALLLRPIPVPAPDDYLRIQGVKAGDTDPQKISHPDFLDIRQRAQSFTGVAAFDDRTLGYAAKAGDVPQIQYSYFVSGNFFQAAGIAPALGRDFRPDEDQVPGRDAVTLISHYAWVNLFQSDPAIVGRKVRLTNREFTIIGVTPESFYGLRQFARPAFFVPLMMSGALAGSPENNFLERRDRPALDVLGRLRPGVSFATARAELATLGQQFAAAYPATHATRGLTARTELQTRIEQSPPDAMLVAMLLSTVALVLLIACANVANLLLARGRGRAREVAVRLALGANRGRLFRQLFTESLVLALAGGALGVAFGWLGIRFLSGIPIVTDIPIQIDIWLDRRVLGFTLAVAVASSLVFGIIPALRSLRPDLTGALKAGDLEDHSRRSRGWGRHALVASQLALSCVLLVAAAMTIAGMRGNLLQDPGFRRDNILMATLSPSIAGYNNEQIRRFFDSLLVRAREINGVQTAALASAVPTANDDINSVNLIPSNYQMRPGQRFVSALSTLVTDGYFPLYDIPILQGRPIERTDTRTAPLVVIVNETFAQQVWPNQHALGQYLTAESGKKHEVIGVAKRSRYLFVSEGPTPAVYFPVAQTDSTRLKLLLRTQGDPHNAIAPLRDVLRSLDSSVPLQAVRTMTDYHAKRTIAIVTMLVQLVAGLGLIGLVLALIGLYGVMAYSVSRRTREIGIRMAIGAEHNTILKLILTQGGRIAGAGTAVGLVVSLFAARLMESGFLGLAVAHPAVFVAVPILLMAVALAACYLPARRATQVEPVCALRCE